MDISRFCNNSHWVKNILKRISDFKKNSAHTKANPEVLKISKAILFLIIGILLAWLSKTETEHKTREYVLQSEWPSLQIWQGTLKQGGWTRLSNTDLSPLLKYHPDPFSDQSIIWESEDHCMIFLPHSPYQKDDSETEFWSCATSQKKPLKTRWHKIGSGYEGLNKLAQIAAPKMKKKTSYIDPREIRY